MRAMAARSIGSIAGDAGALARVIHRRAVAKSGANIVVYVRHDHVYAVRDDSASGQTLLARDAQCARELVGVFGRDSTAHDAREALIEWRELR